MAKSHIESVFMSVKIMHQLAVLSIKEINANGKLAVAGGKLPSKRLMLPNIDLFFSYLASFILISTIIDWFNYINPQRYVN